MDVRLLATLAAGFAPGFEPRYAAPLLVQSLGLPAALALASLEVVVLALVLTKAIGILESLAARLSGRSKLIGRLYLAARRRAERAKGLVERYGTLGLALFVAIPLPFTGMYTGALAALLLGLDGRRAFIALTIGGLSSIALLLAPSAVGVYFAD